MDNKITDIDLRKRKYSLDVLIKNVDNLSIKTLLRWQHLDAEFCKKYILNEEYQCAEDYYAVTIDYVLKLQPHLTYDELVY
jgi:hypothetical protein